MKAFKEFAAEAAQMENQGQVKDAATAWRLAAKVCKKEINWNWSTARVKFCESRFARQAEK